MEKPSFIRKILKTFQSNKVKDYTFISFFFLIFSVFVIFAIRPSLVTAISLRQQFKDLEVINLKYEKVVSNIVANQATLENARDRLYLIDAALPDSALINKLVSDIERAGNENSITFINLNVGEVNLVQKAGNKSQAVTINIEAACTFDNLLKFMQNLSNQRRLKMVKQLSISRDTGGSSESAQLKVIMEIKGFYL